MSLSVRRPRRALAAATLVLAAGAGGTTLATAAHADPPTFTWSGADEIAGNGSAMSDPANWSEGIAPTAGQPVALVFPALDCVVDRTCNQVEDDIAGLTVSSLSITEPNEDFNPNSAFGYTLGGSSMALSGPLTATAPDTDNAAVIDVGLQLDLASPASWSVTQVQLAATAVAGKKLTVNIPSGSVDFDGTWAVKALVVKHAGGGTDLYAGDIAGSSKGSISNGAGPAFFLPSQLGAFAAKKSYLVPFGATTVAGKLSFDKKTSLGLSFSSSTDPSSYPNLTATKAVALGNARVSPTVDCDVPLGAAYTVFSGSAVSGLLDDATGHPVANGGTIIPNPGTCDDGVQPPLLQVTYSATAVTFTAVSNGDQALRSTVRPATRRVAVVGGVAITR